MGPRQVLVLVLVLLLGVFWCGAEEGDTGCSAGRRCVSTVDCPAYQRATERLQQLDRGSAEYRQGLARLKQAVCNKQLRRVCCLATSITTTTPSTTTTTTPPQPPTTTTPSVRKVATTASSAASTAPSYVPGVEECGVGESLDDLALVRKGDTMVSCMVLL